MAQPAELSGQLKQAGQVLLEELTSLHFSPPVAHVYNPLGYAWAPYASYLEKYASTPKRVIFLGMNPGPFGMVQTGIPFGEIRAVRDWLGINATVLGPDSQHPRRPILGFGCSRSEVSGRRLWGLFAARFGDPQVFFQEHFVLNYCPLAFLEESGANRTPDKLPAAEKGKLFDACNRHLARFISLLDPKFVIGVGNFAANQARQALANSPVRIESVLHPSPANPAANRDWAGAVSRELERLGVWTSGSR